VFCSVIGVVFGMIPALTAGRLNPTSGLRYLLRVAATFEAPRRESDDRMALGHGRRASSFVGRNS
jgi:hypothetical protein